jgi:hypothetical protein
VTMLFISLIMSAILLVGANVSAVWLAKSARGRGLLFGAFAACGVGMIGLPVIAGLFIPTVVVVQFAILSAVLLLWWERPRRPIFFLAISLLATVAAYGVAGCFALHDESEYARLRERFPYESMEARLSMPPPRIGLGPCPDRTTERLTDLENSVEEKSTHRGRIDMLRQLHEDRVMLFVNSPGFGVARTFRPTASRLNSDLRKDPPLLQPSPSGYLPSPTGEVAPDPRVWEGEPLYRMHRDAIADFAYPEGFGFAKDRRHVAGFKGHQFSRVPEPQERWEVQRVELVGLLLHKEPAAYVTEHLPRMDELVEAPTRPLDRFEASALERLRRGEDLLCTETSVGMRMLGAIRGVKQCMDCHGGERGDLLGAFSYTLHRSTAETGAAPHRDGTP